MALQFTNTAFLQQMISVEILIKKTLHDQDFCWNLVYEVSFYFNKTTMFHH